MLIERQVDGRPAKKRPTILVLPGGGYGFVSDREGEPVARYFNAKGFNCFVLRYTINTGEACFPAPLPGGQGRGAHPQKTPTNITSMKTGFLSSVFGGRPPCGVAFERL